MSILLQSWNLLTRTSQSFEFVNIRLTVIWIIGFIFRYCVLLPGRILILGVGVSTNLKYSFLKLRCTFKCDTSWHRHVYNKFLSCQLCYLMTMTAFIGLIPWVKARNILYKYAAKVSFRIMARAVSADVTFHNRQHKAKNDGICVANHSTPWDAVMLSCDNTYALVSVCRELFRHVDYLGAKYYTRLALLKYFDFLGSLIVLK